MTVRQNNWTTGTGRLEEEHVTVQDVLDDIDRALVAFVSTPDDLPELGAAFDLLSDALLSHLAYEQRALLDAVSRLGLR